MLPAVLFVALGVVLALGGLLLWAWLDEAASDRARRRALIQQQQRDAEHRLQSITQAALQRMLDVSRGER